MLKPNEVEEIKKLIKYGFDLDLISFEFDIPIEDIKQCKLELEEKRKNDLNKKRSTKKVVKNNQPDSKIKQMRERYKKLFLSSDTTEFVQQVEISKSTVDKINLVITEIEEIAKKIKELPKKEGRKEGNILLKQLKKIENDPLTIEQAEKLLSLMQSEKLGFLKLNNADNIDIYINKRKRKIVRKLAEAVDIAQSEIEDIEELKRLKKELTANSQIDHIYVGVVKSRIENKISRLTQQKAINRIKNQIPKEIEDIIIDIAKGRLDISKANEIIEKEAQKRVNSKPQNKFTLTEEQEKRQILIQIKTVLRENPEKYYIENPERTIMQVQELCGGELEQAISVVVKNLINIKDFNKAKGVCDNFYKKSKESSFLIYIRRLKKQIRNGEIGELVLKLINMNGSEEEEIANYQIIEKGLEMGNIKLDTVVLGKSKDGLRTITLADVWADGQLNRKGIDKY